MGAFDRDNFNQSDVFWRRGQNYHVYEDEFRAKTPSPGSALVWNTAGEQASYDIGLAKARALDVARRELIEASHAKAVETFGAAAANQTKLSVNGADVTSDDAIKL